MPSFVLGANVAGVIMRHTRSAMLTALSADYIRTARAKGLPRFVIIVRHGFRNALVPLITISALQMGALLSGAVLTEQVFTIPGFGRLIVESVYTRDYSVVQGVVLATATIYVFLNLLADVAYAVADPRVRR
jgi:peptide/nickel transport system permease protein